MGSCLVNRNRTWSCSPFRSPSAASWRARRRQMWRRRICWPATPSSKWSTGCCCRYQQHQRICQSSVHIYCAPECHALDWSTQQTIGPQWALNFASACATGATGTLAATCPSGRSHVADNRACFVAKAANHACMCRWPYGNTALAACRWWFLEPGALASPRHPCVHPHCLHHGKPHCYCRTHAPACWNCICVMPFQSQLRCTAVYLCHCSGGCLGRPRHASADGGRRAAEHE
jgi:hypothetical protein